MSIVSTESNRFEMMEKVAEKTLQGFSATAISKELGIKRAEVLTLQEDYRTALSNDHEARDMARDYLNLMVTQYDSLIKKFYELLDEIDQLPWNAAAAAQKNAALKGIAELAAKRVDALQKAGLLDSAELGDEIAKFEEDKEMILSILKDLCVVCQPKVANRISKLMGNDVQSEDVIDVEVMHE